jgi:hypothetical protein
VSERQLAQSAAAGRRQWQKAILCQICFGGSGGGINIGCVTKVFLQQQRIVLLLQRLLQNYWFRFISIPSFDSENSSDSSESER